MMNKKIIALMSAIVMCGSIFTVSAATSSKKSTTSAAMQALQDQLKTNQKSKNDIISQAKQSDSYKQLEAKTIELQKQMIDQEVTDGKLTADQATKLKSQLDARTKMSNDTDLQNLLKNVQTYMSDLKTLEQKYTDNKTLIASQDFKDLKVKVVTNAKAIIDRYVTDGAITSDEATKEKANVDTISTNIDNGKENINRLFMAGMHDGAGMGRGQGRGFGGAKGFGMGRGLGGDRGFGCGRGFGGRNSNMKNFRGNGFGKDSKASNSGTKSTTPSTSSSAAKTHYNVVRSSGSSI